MEKTTLSNRQSIRVGNYFYNYVIKRLFDFIFSLLSLIFLSPLFILITIVLLFQNKGHPCFAQTRVGANEKNFTLFKFRTLPISMPSYVTSEELIIDKKAIGGFRYFLRKSGLDELPQLLNIVKGDMSFIGPRPAISVDKDLLKLRKTNGSYLLRPGLTGLAQINSLRYFRIEEKAKFDGEYNKKISFLMDLKLLLKTISFVVRR
ncbi:MAG TPA: sugar transferase [Bacilli bacterium]|nr:sugar transferase [Bacilli bacterium]